MQRSKCNGQHISASVGGLRSAAPTLALVTGPVVKSPSRTCVCWLLPLWFRINCHSIASLLNSCHTFCALVVHRPSVSSNPCEPHRHLFTFLVTRGAKWICPPFLRFPLLPYQHRARPSGLVSVAISHSIALPLVVPSSALEVSSPPSYQAAVTDKTSTPCMETHGAAWAKAPRQAIATV